MSALKKAGRVLWLGLMMVTLFGLIFVGGHATARLPGADTTMYVEYVGTNYVVVEGNLLLPEQRELLELEDDDIVLLGPAPAGMIEVFKVTNSDLRHELRGTTSAHLMELRLVESQPMRAFSWTGPDYRNEEVFLINGERKVFRNALVVWVGSFDLPDSKPSSTPARGAHAPRAVFFPKFGPIYLRKSPVPKAIDFMLE